MQQQSMELKIRQETSTALTVAIRKASLNTVNNLRRILLCDIKTPFFKWIEIVNNTTSIREEAIANRLMTIPIDGPFDDEDDPIVFRLDKQLDATTGKPYIIKSDDILPDTEKAENYEIEPDVIVTSIQPGESLEIIIYLSSELENTKNASVNCPVTTCSYRRKRKCWVFTLECHSVFNCKKLLEKAVGKLNIDYHFV